MLIVWLFLISILLLRQAVFSAAAQLTASVLASSEEKRMSPDEDEFHSCQSGSSTTSSGSTHGSVNSVNDPIDVKDSSSRHDVTPPGSTKTTLTSVMDSLVPNATEHHPLSEVVVVASSNETEETSCPQTRPQLQQTAS